jgi:para-nitrobenzyl esterase
MYDRRSFLKYSLGMLGACAAGMSPAGALPPDKGDLRAITLDTPTGPLRGQKFDDRLVFKGIPYARPPLGPLRFRPAAPLDPHHNVVDAFSFAPAPMQPPFPVAVSSTTLLGGAACSEDCLYLNVWAPIEPGPHPVFVWIYGGGNISGARVNRFMTGAVLRGQVWYA